MSFTQNYLQARKSGRILLNETIEFTNPYTIRRVSIPFMSLVKSIPVLSNYSRQTLSQTMILINS